MTEDKPVLTRYGKILYDKNPSITGEFKCGVKYNRYNKMESAMMVAPGTGEILSNGAFAFIEEKEVDNERFVKLYLDGVAQFGELTKAGSTLFGFIYNEMSGLSGKDKDTVILNYILAQRWKEGLSKRTYERGLSELLEKEFLFRSLATDMYYVNVRFIFNGNRLALVKSYRRNETKKNGTIEHKK